MNWVWEKQAEAGREGFKNGYRTAIEDAAALLQAENLVRVGKWLEDAMIWQGVQGRHVSPKLRAEIKEKPVLGSYVQNAAEHEAAILNTEAERLKRAAPDMLRALRLLHSFFSQGAEAACREHGSILKLTDIVALGRTAIAAAER